MRLSAVQVQAARRLGFNVLYGDASRPAVLAAAGIKRPSAVAVAYARPERALSAVTSLREAFGPDLPILARARDPAHGAELRAAGASVVVVDSLETGLLLGGAMLTQAGETRERADSLAAAVRAALDASAGRTLSSLAEPQRDAIERAPMLEAVAKSVLVAGALPAPHTGDDGVTSCLLPEPEPASER
jgi:voltage-gated potassium channel Kch